MTDEPPVRSERPASGAAARLAALLAEFDHGAGAPDVPDAGLRTRGGTEQQRPLADGSSGSTGRARAPAPVARSEATPAELSPAAAAPVAVTPAEPIEAEPSEADATDAAPPALPYAEPSAEPKRTKRDRSGRWRDPRILLAAMAVLILAIPILAVVGAKTVLNSRAGKVAERNLDPSAPGYLAIVEPTPTALVIQHDAFGRPVSATVLALGTGDAGGSILFIPLDTKLVTPALFIDRYRTAFKNGDAALASVIARELNIGFDKVVTVGDSDWAQLVAPVSPLHLDNPVQVTLGDTTFAPGPIELPADEVGAYLATSVDGQDDLDRLNRQQLVWRTWLQAIAGSGTATVPVTTNGLGPFITTLASGQTSMATLDVVPSATPANDGTPTFDPQAEGILEQVTDAVPSPISPGLDARFSCRVLNGVNGDPIPDELIKRLVQGGAQVDALGNATRFGARKTTIVYRSARMKPKAESVRDVLGGGKIIFDAQTNDPVDLVIVLGRDALESVAGG